MSDREEDRIEREVVGRAKRAGWVVRKVQWVGRRGAADRVFFGHGRCVWVEFKAPGKKPEGQQAIEIRRLRSKYPGIYVCDSVDEALSILKIE